MAGYAVPEVLVDTAWVEDHKNDPKVRLVEVDVDTSGVRPGAHSRRHRLELDDAALRHASGATSSPKDEFERLMAQLRGSATTPPSCSTATTTTGSPPGRSGR